MGREAQLRVFREALRGAEAPYAVLHVHGPAGVGKTALLEAFADEASSHGVDAVRLDGRDLNSSPTAFLAGLRRALDLGDDASPLAALSDGTARVLLVDTYEAMSSLDEWVRDWLVPRLPDTTVVVLAGREPPTPGWRTDPGWHELLRTVALDNLSAAESRALLRSREVPEELHERLVAFSHGHPLALSLVVDVLRQEAGDGRPVWESRMPDVVGLLLERFLTTVPSPLHRQALEACAVTRATTEDLLRAALDRDDVSEVFGWLRGLSFVQQGPFGLFPHDLARDALDADLRWRDPSGHAALGERIRRHLIDKVRRSEGEGQERATFDLFYLHRHNPFVAPYVYWGERSGVWLERARSEDHEHVVRLVETAEGPDSARIAAFWLARQPEAFLVCRRQGRDHPVAVMACLRLPAPVEEQAQADPIVTAAWEHVRRAGPVRPGEHLVLYRFLVDPECYQRPSEIWTLMQGHFVKHSLVDQDVAWTITALVDAEYWAPNCAYMDVPLVPGAHADVGGRRYHLGAHDWRRTPPDAWSDLLTERLTDSSFDPAAVQPTSSGQPVLPEAEFADAVRQALRDLRSPRRLAGSALLRTALVRERAVEADPVEALVDLVSEAVDALRDEPDGDKRYRAVDRTYVRPAPSQERAAEVLGVPFSTYRRHLARGVAGVTAWLWQRELSRPRP